MNEYTSNLIMETFKDAYEAAGPFGVVGVLIMGAIFISAAHKGKK